MAKGNYSKKPQTTNVATVGLEMGKVPPQALDLEEAVLGAMMLEKDAIMSVMDVLKPEAFYKEANQKIFLAISRLSTRMEPIDIYTVSQELKRTEELDEVGGPYYLTQLTLKVGSAAHVEFHAKIIAQKFIQRELIRISSDIQRNSFDETIDVEELLDTAQMEIFNLAEGNVKKEALKMDTIVKSAIAQIEEASKRTDGLSGVPTGFVGLDRLTSGWQPSDLIIVAARPAMGKTAFTLSMARNMSVDHKRPVAFFSLEMGAVQLVMRLIIGETGIESDKIKNGKLEPHEWAQLEMRIKDLTEAPLFIDDTPALSIFEFRSKVRRLKTQHDISIVIIDYLQLMVGPPETRGNREQEVSVISRSLKAIAKELNIPIIALSQLNRSVETRGGNKRPQLSDLRESGAIEQDADIVSFIHRPEYYGHTEDEDGNSLIGIAEIIIAKHRNGSVDDVRLRFQKEGAKFLDLEDGDISAYANLLPQGNTSGGGMDGGAQAFTVGSKMNNDFPGGGEFDLGVKGGFTSDVPF